MIIDNLNPGDIVVQKLHDEEVGRYLVLTRTMKRPSSSWLYCQYECLILLFKTEQFGLRCKPGELWYIDNIDLKAPGEKWEVMVESGISWEEVEAKKT